MRKILIGMALLTTILSGCQEEETHGYSEDGASENRFEMGDSFNRTRIFEDTKTGCRYLFIKASNAGGLSPLYDENGNIDCDKTK